MQTRRFTTPYSFIQRSIGAERWRSMTLLLPGFLLGACSDDGAAAIAMAGSAGAGAGGSGTAGSGGDTAGGGSSSTAGSGGSGGSGTAGTGGSSTAGAGGMMGRIMDDPEFAFKVLCPPPPQPLILDFTPASGDAVADAGAADAGAPAPVRDATFGSYGVTFAGGTYSYPTDGTWPIESDVSEGNWHLTGNVGTFSGFGLYIGGCNLLDVSAYDGISFTISGNVAMGNALTMNVGVSADQVSHLWVNRVSMPPPTTPAGINSGRCIPVNNQYDGTCTSPAFSVPVTAQPTTVTVLWSQLTGGSPAASVDPREIVGISWSFPAPPGAGDPVAAMPYPMDIVIDNISFVDNP